MRWILLTAVLVAAAILGVGLFAPTARAPVEAGVSFASGALPEPLPARIYAPPRAETCLDAPRFAAAAARNVLRAQVLLSLIHISQGIVR